MHTLGRKIRWEKVCLAGHIALVTHFTDTAHFAQLCPNEASGILAKMVAVAQVQ